MAALILMMLLAAAAVAQATTGVNLVEGDMVLDAHLLQTMTGKKSAYDGLVSTRRHWPNGVVPYVFASNFDSRRRKVVAEGIAEMKKYTCIRFVPRTNEKSYVRFMIGNGCYSSVGRTGWRQDISIGDHCWFKGTVVHEILHAIGFYHEQSRLDRDKYIRIYWKNIFPKDKVFAFQKYSHGVADYFGEPYDLDSIMHYENFAFSNGQKTIDVIGDTHRRLGQRQTLSQIDARQINKMYKCKGIRVTPPPSTYVCKDIKASKDCAGWAGIGHCHSNYKWMSKYCKQTCKFCPKTVVTKAPWTRAPVTKAKCRDFETKCGGWAQRGECRTNPSYMKAYCAKSCKWC